MKVKAGIIIGIGAFTMITVIGLGKPPLSGPGVQAAQDAREPEVLKTCKTPPSPARGFGGPGRGAFPPPSPVRDYTITAGLRRLFRYQHRWGAFDEQKGSSLSRKPWP